MPRISTEKHYLSLSLSLSLQTGSGEKQDKGKGRKGLGRRGRGKGGGTYEGARISWLPQWRNSVATGIITHTHTHTQQESTQEQHPLTSPFLTLRQARGTVLWCVCVVCVSEGECVSVARIVRIFNNTTDSLAQHLNQRLANSPTPSDLQPQRESPHCHCRSIFSRETRSQRVWLQCCYRCCWLLP